MIKLAIVEDELFMREFLQNCIDYKEIGAELCGSFCCAEDALEALAQAKPDLVITDIVMPGMNGIEFMSEMLKINKDTHFVVISNYQDFEIVRSAFRIGICDYIPKIDFEPDQYRETIKTFAQSISGESETQPHQGNDDMLKEIFWGEVQIEERGLKADDFLQHKIRFALIDIINYESVCQKAWNMDKGHLKYEISGYLCTELTNFGHAQFFFDEYDKLVLLFAIKDDVEITRVLNVIRTGLIRHFGFCVGVYLDDAYTSIRDLRAGYAQLYNLREIRFFLREDEIITNNISREFTDSFDYTKANNEMERFFEKREFDAILKRMNEYAELKPNADSIESLKFFWRNMLHMTTNYIKNLGVEIAPKISIKEIMEYYNYEKAFDYIDVFLGKISEHMFYPDKKLVQRVDDYVHKHYAEELTLEEIANHFQYEYGYFSKIFRKHMGVTFKRYLNNIRLERAMKLIVNSSLKFSEIAIAVGYKNYEHFSRLFREQYGCSPKEIQRNDIDV